MPEREFVNHVRLTEKERLSLLNRIDHAAQKDAARVVASGNDQRHDPRLPFRQQHVPLEVDHPGGSFSRLLVVSRNLSAGGFSFMHGGFLHVGSTCRLLLRRTEGTLVPMGARIASCRLVQAPVHEIGVAFDERIDPLEFLDPEEDAESASAPQPAGDSPPDPPTTAPDPAADKVPQKKAG